MDRKNPSDMPQDASALAFSMSIREALEQWLGMRRGMRGVMEPCKRLCLGPNPVSALPSKKLPKVQFWHTWPERQRQPKSAPPLHVLRVSLRAPGFAPEPLQEPDCKLKDRDAHFLLPVPYLAGRAHLQPQHQAMVRARPTEPEIPAGTMGMDSSGTQTYVGRGCPAGSNLSVQDLWCLL